MNTVLIILVLILSLTVGFLIGKQPRKPKKAAKKAKRVDVGIDPYSAEGEEIRRQKRRQKEFENMMTYDGSAQEEIRVD